MSYKCTLSPELLEKAAKELTEDPKTRHLEIKTLRERVEKNPALKIPTDDAFLLRFLRARKFDQERAYKMIMTFYQMKTDHADLYATMTPSGVKHCLDAAGDAFPVRVKAVHVINEPPMFDIVFSAVRPFLKEKIKSRMFFHGNKLEELREFIDADCLPEDYGGNLPPYSNKKFVKELMQCESEFKKETQFGLINMKLKGEKKSGTFKKLNVD